MPFSPEELQEVATAFAERCKGSGKNLALPATDAAIDFKYVEFEQDAFFTNYLFSRKSSFQSATFSRVARFVRAIFSDDATFADAIFSGYAFFGGADFHGATFSSGAAFGDATFSGDADFDGAIFYHETRFGKATLDEKISFTRFGGSTSFVNAEMKGVTSFEEAIFDKEPSRFFGAKLHQGTVWRGIKWLPLPKTKYAAGSFIDAYACLKLEMDRLKKHEDELDFFALKLQSRRILLGPLRGFPITLYWVLSNYGRSYARPLLGLLAVAAIGALLLLFSDALPAEKSFGLSAANTLNVFGFRKDFFEPGVIARLPAWLDVVTALQTIFGTILLFLFGLGIRNKFRMK